MDTLFNQTQAIGGFPMTSYDLTDIDMKQGNTQNLPQRDPKTNKFVNSNMRAPAARGAGLRFS